MEKNSTRRIATKNRSPNTVNNTSSTQAKHAVTGRYSFRLAALAVTVSGLFFSSPGLMAAETAATADLVLRNGNIYTVNQGQPWAEAVAVRDGRYVFIGSNAQAAEFIGPKTQVVDLNGSMAMPGINDVHAHPLDGGYEDIYSCNFAQTSSLDGILNQVSECAQKAGPGEWVVGSAWGSPHMAELSTAEALAKLDKVSNGRPVILRDDSYHNRWINSEAMRLATITAQSVSPAGGVIVKDAKTGEPTGLLQEFPAFQHVQSLVPVPTEEQRLTSGRGAAKTMVSLGITGVQEAVSSEVNLRIWSKIDRAEGLPLRIIGSIVSTPLLDEGAAGLELVARRDVYRTTNFFPDRFKFVLDGVPPAHTAKLIDPYLPTKTHGDHYHGDTHYTTEQVVEILSKLDKQGISTKLHAAGDGSLRLALDAVEQVRKINGPNGPMHQIAHTHLISPQDMPRFAQLRVAADLSPMLWFPSDMTNASVVTIGEERMKDFVPTVKLLRSGAVVAGGSDWPAGGPTPSPWIGIEGLVTRQNPLGDAPGTLAPEEAVDLSEAIRIYTINSAKAMGIEKETGSVELGKSADLIVLDRHLFNVPIKQVHRANVVKTYFKGQLVHSAPEKS
ncbi:amidohydrolase [Pectobacterium parmentieri]|uniref:amidohydrolase n=1 Tax=Pectobacterium parmentieri TaxID=1905730 RepID=UPI000EAD23CD|nr:amidohydrolase [Pectobacterium parmentieri]AYH02802.1 amidohydrolase [Pectobacterium parmentieri]AYH29062.1 amidohydrolase [Pectobacterium parmentieri]AYH33479.1 amidohydrolase [Pectobacterium parmentieri]MBI0517392.1 amidohydrolase [Pectobacterium parmentieri]